MNTNWERHSAWIDAGGMSAASFMKQDSVERKVVRAIARVSRRFLPFLKSGASPEAANPPFIDATVSDYGAHESPDWFVIFWSAVVVVGVGFCALKFFGVV